MSSQLSLFPGVPLPACTHSVRVAEQCASGGATPPVRLGPPSYCGRSSSGDRGIGGGGGSTRRGSSVSATHASLTSAVTERSDCAYSEPLARSLSVVYGGYRRGVNRWGACGCVECGRAIARGMGCYVTGTVLDDCPFLLCYECVEGSGAFEHGKGLYGVRVGAAVGV